MSGRKKSYEQILSEMGRPIDINSIPNRGIDYKGVIAYARSKGVKVFDLPMGERDKFRLPKRA